MSDALKELTKSQKEAVTFGGKALMIVAGAGTGKTTVLTKRIAWLVEQGIKPEKILALTFTDKAASEMETRVDQLLPYGTYGVEISTFHSFCQKVLQQYPIYSHVSESSLLLTEAEQRLFWQNHIMEFPLSDLRPLSNPSVNVPSIMHFISRCKDELISPEKLQNFVNSLSSQAPAGDVRSSDIDPFGKLRMTLSESDSTSNPARAALDWNDSKEADVNLYTELASTYAFYQALIRKHDVLDYGELLFRTHEILIHNKALQGKIGKSYSHILIDEYQDTNHAQIEIIKLLASSNHSITTVGDDDQSIYRFRGAAVGQMEAFASHFDAKIVSLTDNFRSGQTILDTAYNLIQNNNPHRLESKLGISKKLISKTRPTSPLPSPTRRGEGGGEVASVLVSKISPSPLSGERVPVRSVSDSSESQTRTGEVISHIFATDAEEADWITGQIRQKIESNSFAYDDFCILVRTNRQSQSFMQSLKQAGIPFTTESDVGLAANPTIQLILNFLKSVANPLDSLAIYFLATSPAYDMSGSSLTPLLAKARDSHEALETLLRDAENAKQLLADLTTARDLIPKSHVGSIVTSWLQTHPWWQTITEDPQFETDQGAVLTFLRLIHQFERTSVRTDLYAFLESVQTLLTDYSDASEDSGGVGAVRLYTVHQAKGLEFPIVFVTNLTKDRFPTIDRHQGFDVPTDLIQDKAAEGEHLREERRLLYVATTRAKNELIFTRAEHYGNTKARPASPFWNELGLEGKSESISNDEQGGVGEILPLTSPSLRLARVRDRPIGHPLPQGEGRGKGISNLSISVSPHSLDDYMQCPLRYRYRYIDQIPAPYDQNQMIGQCIHKAIEHYFTKRMASEPVKLDELEQVIEGCFHPRGFTSLEHADLRKADARKQVRQFVTRYDSLPIPVKIEESFNVTVDNATLRGRIDAIFDANLPGTPDGASTIILDFKTTDRVLTQEKADKKASESLQLRLYALAWEEQYGSLPDACGLYFTSSDLFGWTVPTRKKIGNSKEKILQVVADIRASQFEATPDPFTCAVCPFKSFCPFSMAP